MYKIKNNELCVSDIACYLNTSFIGEDITVFGPNELGCEKDNVFIYYEGQNKEILSSIDTKVLAITSKENYVNKKNISYIFSDSPKKDFYIIVNEFFVQGILHSIHKTAKISSGVKLGVNVHIGRNTYIDEDVVVGNNTYIGNNVIISSNTIIGSNCIIKHGSVIGSERFDFIDDGDGIVQIPQFGGIFIDENVWIGANTSIEKPFLGNTHIGKMVKIDDQVHIGQGAKIGEGTKITAGCVLAADVIVHKNCFLGINSSVKEGVTIGENSIIGMGSAVINDIEENTICVGVPAKTK